MGAESQCTCGEITTLSAEGPEAAGAVSGRVPKYTRAAWPRQAQLRLLGLPGPGARFSHEGLSDSRPQSSKQEFGNDLTLLPSPVQLPFDPQVGTDEDCLL